jgi:hypothetical protein
LSLGIIFEYITVFVPQTVVAEISNNPSDEGPEFAKTILFSGHTKGEKLLLIITSLKISKYYPS